MSDFPISDALIGQRLGTSRVERLLGAGGMSAIYLAQQERPRRSVAVKVLRPQLLADARQWPQFLARFRREADATAALDHANIMPIYEFGEQDDLAYLIMPYLPDGSLATLLAREGPLPIPQTLSYAEQVASALDYAHQHGIVHRDVKPSNLLLHPDGRLLLADFGIARPLDQRGLPDIELASHALADAGLTIGGVTLGTPDYMAPEQIRGERVGPAADIYALGVVTYAMLTGRAPFGGGATAQVLARQLNDPPPPLRIARPDASARMEEVIFWALAKDGTARPSSAGAFARALRESVRGPLGSLWQRAAGQGASLASFRSGALSAPSVVRAGLSASSDATLWDPAYHQPRSNGFDGGGGAPPPLRNARAAQSERQPGLTTALIAAVALALVVLVVMGVVVANALGSGIGATLLGGSPSRPAVVATLTPTPTATLTPTPSPTPSPTPPVNWLSVQPDALTLTCQKNQKTQYVHLTNLGPSALGWVARLPDFAGVKVSPSSGTLEAGGSVTISVTNTTTFIGRQSQFQLMPTNVDAGAPATVSYSTEAC